MTVMSSPGSSVSTHPISSLSPYQNKYVYFNITVCASGHSELETTFVQSTVVMVNAVYYLVCIKDCEKEIYEH